MLTEQQIEKALDCMHIVDLPETRAHMEKVAQFLQYAPTAPGAPLTQDEKVEISKISQRPFGCLQYIGQAWPAIDAVLAKRNTTQPAPEPGAVSLDAVEKAVLGECKHIRWENTNACINANTFAKEVLARLCPPKTPEERVVLHPSSVARGYFYVYLDGDCAWNIAMPEDLAKYAAAGLREKLAKEEHE